MVIRMVCSSTIFLKTCSKKYPYSYTNESQTCNILSPESVYTQKHLESMSELAERSHCMGANKPSDVHCRSSCLLREKSYTCCKSVLIHLYINQHMQQDPTTMSRAGVAGTRNNVTGRCSRNPQQIQCCGQVQQLAGARNDVTVIILFYIPHLGNLFQ